MDHVTCPHCGKDVELSEAIVHQLQAKVREEEQKRLRAEFERQKAEEKVLHEKHLREEFEKENRQREKELEQTKLKEKELLEKLAKEQEERIKAEEKIKADAHKKAEQDFELRFKQMEIQLDQARKANDDLKRKLEQGSQQLQGEALELNLEEKLRKLFPADEFLPVPKGVEGGDIWQRIYLNGKITGSILWETKRTKAWSKGWLVKLKEDAAKINASEAIIVSQVLPDDVAAFDRKDGIWVTNYEYAVNTCRFVRFLVSSIASAKSSANHTEEEWTMLRDYMTSDAFKHRMQAHIDIANMLRTTLEAEKRSTQLRWKKQEALIEKLDTNSLNLYGELKAIVANLPELNNIEAPIIANEDEKNNQALF